MTGIEIAAPVVRDIAEIRLGEFVGNLADGGEDTFSDSVVKVAAESLVGLSFSADRRACARCCGEDGKGDETAFFHAFSCLRNVK